MDIGWQIFSSTIEIFEISHISKEQQVRESGCFLLWPKKAKYYVSLNSDPMCKHGRKGIKAT